MERVNVYILNFNTTATTVEGDTHVPSRVILDCMNIKALLHTLTPLIRFVRCCLSNNNFRRDPYTRLLVLYGEHCGATVENGSSFAPLMWWLKFNYSIRSSHTIRLDANITMILIINEQSLQCKTYQELSTRFTFTATL